MLKTRKDVELFNKTADLEMSIQYQGSTTADETSSCQEDQKRTGVTKEQMKKETIQRHGDHLDLTKIARTKIKLIDKHCIHMAYTCILSSVVLLCFNSG